MVVAFAPNKVELLAVAPNTVDVAAVAFAPNPVDGVVTAAPTPVDEVIVVAPSPVDVVSVGFVPNTVDRIVAAAPNPVNVPDVVAPKPVDVVVDCSSNDECPEYAACLNGACRNPCAYDDPCAPNAFCKVIFHSAKCACPAGYIGDPQTECRLPPRKTKITCIRCVIKWVML